MVLGEVAGLKNGKLMMAYMYMEEIIEF